MQTRPNEELLEQQFSSNILQTSEQLIQTAVLNQDGTKLKEAIIELEKLVKIENVTLSQKHQMLKAAFDCYIYLFALIYKCDFKEEVRLWNDYKEKLVSWEAGFEYLITRFFKFPYEAKQYQQVIEASIRMLSTIYILKYSLFNDHPEFPTFKKRIMIYSDLAQKAPLPNPPLKVNAPDPKSQIDDNQHAVTPVKNEVQSAAQKKNQEIVKNQMIMKSKIFACCNAATANPPLKTSDIVNITSLLTSLVLNDFCIDRETKSTGSDCNQYIEKSLKELETSRLMYYVMKPAELKIGKQSNLFNLAVDMMMEILLKSFPLLPISKTNQVINRMNENLRQIVNESQQNPILTKLSLAVINKLDLFCSGYTDFYNFYIKCDTRYNQHCLNMQELVQWDGDLNRYIEKVIPNQCVKILANFHDKVITTNVWLMEQDKKNSPQYKRKIIDHYKLKRRDPAFKCANDLYKAGIPNYEVDNDLLTIFKEIKKNIQMIESNKSMKSEELAVRILASVYKGLSNYLNHLHKDYFGVTIQSEITANQSLPQNIVNLFSNAINGLDKLLKNNAITIINYCQALEVLVKAIKSDKITPPTFYQNIIHNLLDLKMKACHELIEALSHQTDTIETGTIIYLGDQYLVDTSILKQNPAYKINEDKLLAILNGLIRYWNQNGNQEKMKHYLNQGLSFFPQNESFQMHQISIEYDLVNKQIQQIKEIKNMSDRKLMADKLDVKVATSEIPMLPDITSTNSKLIAEHKLLIAKHQELKKQLACLKTDNSAIKPLIDEHQILLAQLHQFSDHSDLDKINEAKSNCTKFKELDEKILSIYKNINTNISKYIKDLAEFEKMKEQFTALHNEVKEMERRAEEKRLEQSAKRKKMLEERAAAEAKRIEEKKALELKKLDDEQKQLGEELISLAKERTQLEEELKSLQHEHKNFAEEYKNLEAQQNVLENELKLLDEELRELELKKLDEELIILEKERNQLVDELKHLENELKNSEEEYKNLEGNKKTLNEELKLLELELRKREEEHAQAMFERMAAADHIVLNGANHRISLDTLAFLNKLDIALRKIGSRLIIKSSLTARFGIYCFNEKPESASLFRIGDIDIHIPFDPNVNMHEIMAIIKDFGFSPDGVPNGYYKQFTKKFETDVDLTVPTNPKYCSHEYLIMRMATLEFCDATNQANPVYSNPKSKNEYFVKIYNHSFKLILPPGLEDIYIKACLFKAFPMLKPNLNFSSYCYGIFKYALKVAACGVNFNTFNTEKDTSSNLIYWDQLLQELVNHFDLHLPNIACYYELKDFMTKGVPANNIDLAANLISTLYFSYIKKAYFGFECWPQDPYKVAKQCAIQFIRTYGMGNMNRNDIDINFIKSAFEKIVHHKVQSMLSTQYTNQTHYPQGNFFQPVPPVHIQQQQFNQGFNNAGTPPSRHPLRNQSPIGTPPHQHQLHRTQSPAGTPPHQHQLHRTQSPAGTPPSQHQQSRTQSPKGSNPTPYSPK